LGGLPSRLSRKINEGEEDYGFDLSPERVNVSKKEITFSEAKLVKDPITVTETVDVPVTYEELIVERRPASRDTYSSLDLRLEKK
jgi:uncharacterized protein (TIGR02271 family)